MLNQLEQVLINNIGNKLTRELAMGMFSATGARRMCRHDQGWCIVW